MADASDLPESPPHGQAGAPTPETADRGRRAPGLTGAETPGRQSPSSPPSDEPGHRPKRHPGSGSTTLQDDFRAWLRARSSTDSSGAGDTISTLSELDDGLRAPALPTAVEEIYEDRGEIGHGGMGAVRRVFDRRLRREAALKILKRDVGRKHREVRRFVEEAQITGQLDHPNIVPIHDLSQDAMGSHYFTMKLVQGRTLEEAIDAAGERRLDPDVVADFLQILVKVCEAVSFAHSRGVVHRDLKPANIMVGEFGQVYVMDWGIARLLPRIADPDADAGRRLVTVSRSEAQDIDVPGTILGTPRYMAPEQVNGDHEATDHRADVFALGGVLYQILTGHAPYTEQNYFSLLVQVQACELERPHEIPGCERVPAELERIALRAMAADPGERYPSVVDLQKDVERFLRGVWHLPTDSFPPGTAIVTEGDEGDAAYIIRKGRCRVLKNINGHPTEVRTMGPGDVFGETAIFSSSRRSATVETVDEVEVTVVTSEVLTQGLGLNSWMGDFVKALARRFREVDDRLH
ncbi:MAG: serine/threonine-protein kinase, partial [Holophagales bacterium]|nr:serine/threonine-protein kinase [Holophagales bacterium]